MKKLFTLFLVALFADSIHSQNITVVDKTTREAIPGVTIVVSGTNQYAVTNYKGAVPRLVFENADSICFRHVGYAPLTVSWNDIAKKRFRVELTAKSFPVSEITVSANRWEENFSENPYTIRKIEKRQIQIQNPQTAADLLGSTGYAYIQKSQLAGGSPMLRGFATNRVLLVIDGVRMNNAIFRSGNLQNVISLDASAMENTEILFGPGAVMYGSDAIGGVMDFHTLHPALTDSSESLLFSGNALVRYSTANSEKTGHIDFNTGLKKIAFVTSLSYSDYGDLRAGTNGNDYFLRPYYQETINGTDSQLVNTDPSLQINSGYSQVNLMQKVLYAPTNGLEIEYSFHYSETSDAPRYDRLCLDANADSMLDYAEWYYGPQKWMMNRLSVVHRRKGGLYDQVRIVTALQNYEESRHDRKFNNARLRNQTESVDAWSLNVDFDKELSDKTSLFYGGEMVLNEIGSVANRVNIFTSVEAPTNTRYPNGSKWQTYGSYMSVRYKMKPKWTLNLGLRYTYYLVKADFDTSMFPFPFVHAENSNGSLNGSTGIVFSPDKKTQLYFNLATGFRAPNIDDIGKVFESEPGAVVVPNADLKPEYAYNIEIGTSKIFGDLLKFDFAAYYTLLDKALVRRDFTYNGADSILYDGQMSKVQAIQNISNAWVYGVQAGIELDFGKGAGMKSVLSYQYGKEQSEDSLIYYPKSHLAPMFGSTHITYKRKSLLFDLYMNYNAGLDYEDLALSERNDDAPYAKDVNGKPFVPGWYTLNFKATWFVNSHFSLNAGVENITDQLYRPYASGISAAGRNFMVSLRGKF